MDRIAAIREIETAAYEAWPAAELVEYDGWELRFAHGFSRRGNSVYPAQPSTIDRELKLTRCAEWYGQRALDLVVRQNPATEPGLDEMLDSAGFTREGPTNVMASDVVVGGATYPVAETATPEWWSATAELWDIGAERMAGWRGIIERINLPAGFVLINEGTRPVAAGLAVAVDEWLGLFEIVVAPDRRRLGIGGRLTRSLVTWGAAQGARKAFLQVVAEKGPAIAMYESMGFELAYRYWYRRAPAQRIEAPPFRAAPHSTNG